MWIIYFQLIQNYPIPSSVHFPFFLFLPNPEARSLCTRMGMWLTQWCVSACGSTVTSTLTMCCQAWWLSLLSPLLRDGQRELPCRGYAQSVCMSIWWLPFPDVLTSFALSSCLDTSCLAQKCSKRICSASPKMRGSWCFFILFSGTEIDVWLQKPQKIILSSLSFSFASLNTLPHCYGYKKDCVWLNQGSGRAPLRYSTFHKQIRDRQSARGFDTLIESWCFSLNPAFIIFINNSFLCFL